jgi:hypothetical protein
LYNSALGKISRLAEKPTSPMYKKYKANPELIEQDARRLAIEQMNPEDRELLSLKEATVKEDSSPPAPAPGKSFPKPSTAAISALKSRKDLDIAKKQFDAVFGPGSAQKALGN